MNYMNRPINHVNLSVPDLEKAVEFYTKTMGFEVKGRYTKGDSVFYFISDGTILYEMVEKAGIENAYVDHIAYDTVDFEKEKEEFRKMGILTDIMGYADFIFENGMDYFFIKGPCGELIEFCHKR